MPIQSLTHDSFSRNANIGGYIDGCDDTPSGSKGQQNSDVDTDDMCQDGPVDESYTTNKIKSKKDASMQSASTQPSQGNLTAS